MMSPKQARSDATKDELLSTAERLFAHEGIDAVSTRRISQEARQRNNSALQYHYGDREALLTALVTAHMGPINRRRRELLVALEGRRQRVALAELVAVLVVPFVEQLLDVGRGCNYVRIAAQIFAQSQAERLLGPERPWNDAFYATVRQIRPHLSKLPRAVQDRRIRFLAGHLVQATAAAEIELRGLAARSRVLRVRAFSGDLVDYTAGALVAPRRRRSLIFPAPPAPLAGHA
jgi:AcrR family transcriptional regulator